VVAGRGLAHAISWVAGQGLPARPVRHAWEARVLVERTSVGLDVHARSVAAAAIDGVTGELLQAKLTPSHDPIRSWISGLAGPGARGRPRRSDAGPTPVVETAAASGDRLLRRARLDRCPRRVASPAAFRQC